MKLSEFYNAVSRRADTGKTAITVADTKRVLSEAFLVLSKMDATDSADTIAKGLATAKKKSTKKKRQSSTALGAAGVLLFGPVCDML